MPLLEFLRQRHVFEHYGITRLGSLTGLDRIGVPVWFATRPNSRSLSVSQGKGMVDEKAQITALMEAVEGAVAERPEAIVSKTCSLKELQAFRARHVAFDSLARCKPHRIDPNLARAWVEGRCHRSGEAVYAPFELVGIDARSNRGWDHGAFRMSTHGLAAGPSRDFAIRHALLELIEGDALAPYELLGNNAPALVSLPMEQLRGDAKKLARRCVSAGYEPHFMLMRNSLAVPTVQAVIPRQIETERERGVGYLSGSAARGNVQLAARDALLEAIQSRLTEISGARDDLTHQNYCSEKEFFPPCSQIKVELSKFNDLKDDTDSLMTAIFERTGQDIYLFDLPTGFDNVHVVRALVPGLTLITDTSSSMTPESLLSLAGLL